MRAIAALGPLALLVASACRSIEVTPSALRQDGGRPTDRAASLARWEEALVLVNEFLASPYRRTLPPGHFELDEGGMTFATASGCRWPVAVRSTTWGDCVVATGFRAQEGRGGFCVGVIDRVPGEVRDTLLDNTFFRFRDGDWHDSDSLAEVVLHETTHDVYGVGTVGPWNTIGYYFVAVVTFSSAHHPAEDLPRATSEEFGWFRVARSTDSEYRGLIEGVRDEHLAVAHDHCKHGPFPEPACR